MLNTQYPIQYYRYQSKKWERIDAQVIAETPVSLTVNGEVWLTFMCTPTYLEELAIGFLFNERVIDDMSEIEDVRVCEHGDNVDVWLNRSVAKPDKWRRTSGCTGGVTMVEVDESMPVLQNNGTMVSANNVSRLVELLFESQELYRETGGVHTSALSDGEQVIISAEDIGRHNTLDKIAGICLRQEINFENRILLTTGRISSEMLQKAARMNTPVLVSRTSPSSLSVALAEKLGITLIGYARRHRFNIYANPERIFPSEKITT